MKRTFFLILLFFCALFVKSGCFWDRIQWIVMYLPHQPDMLGLYFR